MAAKEMRRGDATGRRKPAPFAWRLLAAVLSAMAVAVLGGAFVVYALWPRWPEAAPVADVPHLPIVVAGETFRVPPGAIRKKMQRRPGPQERIDLVFVWPALTPPPDAPDGGATPPSDRVFLTIAPRDQTAEPAERLRNIYLRYVADEQQSAPDGLTLTAFRDGTPYQGEDLAYDESAPENFVARCGRSTNPVAPASCLLERFVGQANVTVRFSRAHLDDWRGLASRLDQLLADLHPQPAG